MIYEFANDDVELEKECTFEDAKKFYKNNAPIMVMCTWESEDTEKPIDITRLK